MTVLGHLEDISSRLVLTESEKLSILISTNTLATRLDSWFGDDITNRFEFGSYPRVTILPRKADELSDVDYMIVFSTVGGKKKPQTYLDRLRTFANAKYSTSEVYQSHPTLVLSLNHIKFELVPAIYDYGYMIPSPATGWNEWIYTDPQKASEEILDKNKNNYYKIKPLVRLVKYWNATQNYPFASFTLEQHIVNKWFFGCSTLKEYFYEFWSDFECSWNSPQSAKDKVARAKKYAKSAKALEDQGYPVLAESEIQKIVPLL